ncbi:MAG: 4Fe-4S binding protein [Rikenellaceae bacterium]
MPITLDKSKCPHNHVCPLIKVCPSKAISQNGDGYPIIDYDLCIECGKCLHACPMKAMKFIELK